MTTHPITQAEQSMTHTDLVDYLKECEENQDFIPWDDQYHAAAHLVTMFDVSHTEAMCAVVIARVDTKAEYEQTEEIDDAHDEFVQGEQLRRGM